MKRRLLVVLALAVTSFALAAGSASAACPDGGPPPCDDEPPPADTTPPETTIDSGPSGLTSDNTPTFTFSSNEAGSSFECTIDAGAWVACNSGTYTPSGLGDGGHTFKVRATDPSGNTDATPATRSFTVDATPPHVLFASGPGVGTTNFQTNDTTPTFTFYSFDGGASFECGLAAGASAPPAFYTSCTSPYTMPPRSPGWHTIHVRARDAAGNLGPAVAEAFLVDVDAPVVTLDGPFRADVDSVPAEPIDASQAWFRYSVSNEAYFVDFNCRVDGGSWSDCTRPTCPSGNQSGCNNYQWQTAALSDGEHTFELQTTDGAGNVTTTTRTFTVDTTAPETTIDSGPSGTTAETSPSFGFSSNEGSATFECSLDGGAWTSCSSPYVPGPLAEGAHTLHVRATDAAGNTDDTPAARSFTVSLPKQEEQGGTQGGQQPTPTADTTGPAVKLSTKGLKVDRKGVFFVRVTCPGAETAGCAGNLTVTTAKAVASARKRKLVVGKAKFTVQAGKTGRVKVKLTKAGLRALKKAKRLKVVVKVVARDKAGNATTLTKTVTIKAPRRR